MPAVAGMGAGLLTALFITRNGWVVTSVTLGVFVIGAIVGLAFEQARQRSAKTSQTIASALGTVLTGDGAFWSGQLSHIGVVLIAIGMATAANLGAHVEVDLAPGESTEFAGYTITYDSPFSAQTASKSTVGARLSVSDGDRLVTEIEPAVNAFGDDPTGVSTPDVAHLVKGDIYVTLLDVPSGEATSFRFDTSPVIWLIWLGGLVAVAGGLLALAARRARVDADTPQTVDA